MSFLASKQDGNSFIAGMFLDGQSATITNCSDAVPLLDTLLLTWKPLVDPEYRVLQPLWALALRHSYYTASPLFPIVLSLVMYFLCQVPCTTLDVIARFSERVRRYKMQPDVEITWSTLSPALATTCWNHVMYILPVSLAQWVWTPETEMPALAPPLWEFCCQQYVALAIMDAEFYAWHVLHHKVRFLYRHVHSIHHRYSSVNSWVTQHVHPWELYCIGVFATTAPWILHAHPLTDWSFMSLVLAVTVEEHSGYDLPFMPHRWVPFWGGSRKHGMHHQRPMTNFQPFFNWFDRLFGNDNSASACEPNKR